MKPVKFGFKDILPLGIGLIVGYILLKILMIAFALVFSLTKLIFVGIIGFIIYLIIRGRFK